MTAASPIAAVQSVQQNCRVAPQPDEYDDAPSAFFGRLFIALILRASYRRFQSGQSMRPVYLILDEAHEYFDRSISDMLEQARKANIGLIVSHQSISQARGAKGGSSITDPLMVNTAPS